MVRPVCTERRGQGPVGPQGPPERLCLCPQTRSPGCVAHSHSEVTPAPRSPLLPSSLDLLAHSTWRAAALPLSSADLGAWGAGGEAAGRGADTHRTLAGPSTTMTAALTVRPLSHPHLQASPTPPALLRAGWGRAPGRAGRAGGRRACPLSAVLGRPGECQGRALSWFWKKFPGGLASPCHPPACFSLQGAQHSSPQGAIGNAGEDNGLSVGGRGRERPEQEGSGAGAGLGRGQSRLWANELTPWLSFEP